MFLLPVIIIAVVVYFALRPGQLTGYMPPRGGEDPEQILKKRYVSGEIDEETYKKMLHMLRS